MPDLPSDVELLLSKRPHDRWVVAIAAALFVLFVAGVLPRIFW